MMIKNNNNLFKYLSHKKNKWCNNKFHKIKIIIIKKIEKVNFQKLIKKNSMIKIIINII
jgi:hypothetical protein